MLNPTTFRPGSRRRLARPLLASLIACTLAACSDAEVSTAEVQRAAKERVQQELGLSADSALFTNVFVGRERAGEPVLCGTVAGRRADGSEVTARRFIASTQGAGFLLFEPAGAATFETEPDKFASWAELCEGASGT